MAGDMGMVQLPIHNGHGLRLELVEAGWMQTGANCHGALFVGGVQDPAERPRRPAAARVIDQDAFRAQDPRRDLVTLSPASILPAPICRLQDVKSISEGNEKL